MAGSRTREGKGTSLGRKYIRMLGSCQKDIDAKLSGGRQSEVASISQIWDNLRIKINDKNQYNPLNKRENESLMRHRIFV